MTTERLDQVEELVSILVTHAEANDRRIGQLADNQLLIQQDLQVLTARMSRIGDRVEQVAATVEAIAQQGEQDRSQAATDRADFRSTVENILNALVVRFNSNGHGE